MHNNDCCGFYSSSACNCPKCCTDVKYFIDSYKLDARFVDEITIDERRRKREALQCRNSEGAFYGNQKCFRQTFCKPNILKCVELPDTITTSYNIFTTDGYEKRSNMLQIPLATNLAPYHGYYLDGCKLDDWLSHHLLRYIQRKGSTTNSIDKAWLAEIYKLLAFETNLRDQRKYKRSKTFSQRWMKRFSRIYNKTVAPQTSSDEQLCMNNIPVAMTKEMMEQVLIINEKIKKLRQGEEKTSHQKQLYSIITENIVDRTLSFDNENVKNIISPKKHLIFGSCPAGMSNRITTENSVCQINDNQPSPMTIQETNMISPITMVKEINTPRSKNIITKKLKNCRSQRSPMKQRMKTNFSKLSNSSFSINTLSLESLLRFERDKKL